MSDTPKSRLASECEPDSWVYLSHEYRILEDDLAAAKARIAVVEKQAADAMDDRDVAQARLYDIGRIFRDAMGEAIDGHGTAEEAALLVSQRDNARACEDGYFKQLAAATARAEAAERALEGITSKGEALIKVVEGFSTYIDENGFRLKDEKEWCVFYSAIKSLRRAAEAKGGRS